MVELFDILTKNVEIISPATTSAIEKAELLFKLKLPTDYKEFLQFTNGFEGEMDDNYLVVWSAEEIVELNQAYNVKEFISNIILIGSDGAEESFAFDTTNMTIVKLPFIGMGHLPIEKVSNSFSEFLSVQLSSFR